MNYEDVNEVKNALVDTYVIGLNFLLLNYIKLSYQFHLQ